jgi:hypothetical protein
VSTIDQGFFEDLPDFGLLTTLQAAVIAAPSSPGSPGAPVLASAPEPQSIELTLAAGAVLLGFGCMRRNTLKSPNLSSK